MVWDTLTQTYALVFAVGALSGWCTLMFRLAMQPRMAIRRWVIPSCFFGGATAWAAVWVTWREHPVDFIGAVAMAFAFGVGGSWGPDLLQAIMKTKGNRDE